MFEVEVYSAEWCPQCGPFKKALASRGVEFKVFDVDSFGDKAQEKGIRGLPVAIIYKDGEEFKRVVGNKPNEVVEVIKEQ